MDQFKKSNASTAASSNDSTAASNNSGKDAPVNASFGRAVSPPGATPPSTHPLGRLSNKISADRGSPSRSIPSKGTPLAATRGAGNGNSNKDGVGSSGGGGGCGLRLPPSRPTPGTAVSSSARPPSLPAETAADAEHGGGARHPLSSGGGGRSRGTGFSSFASPPPGSSSGRPSTAAAAAAGGNESPPTSAASEALVSSSESPPTSTSTNIGTAQRMRASLAGTPRHETSARVQGFLHGTASGGGAVAAAVAATVAAVAADGSMADGDSNGDGQGERLETSCAGSGEDSDQALPAPGLSHRRSTTSAAYRPMPPANMFGRPEPAAAYDSSSKENPPESPPLAHTMRRSSHGEGDVGRFGFGGGEDGERRGGSTDVVETAREGGGDSGSDYEGGKGGGRAAVGEKGREDGIGARGVDATWPPPGRSLAGPPLARKERATLKAVESSNFRSRPGQNPERRRQLRTGMQNGQGRNDAHEVQRQQDEKWSRQSGDDDDDDNDHDDHNDHDGHNDHDDDNHDDNDVIDDNDDNEDRHDGNEGGTAFFALPDAETDARDTVAKMEQRELWVRQKKAAVAKFRRGCEEEVERIKAVMEEHVGELERTLEEQLDPALDDAVKSSIQRNDREKKRARKVQHLVSAFFGDPRLPKLQRVA